MNLQIFICPNLQIIPNIW